MNVEPQRIPLEPMAPVPPHPQSLFGYLGCSVLAHGAAFVSAWGVTAMYGLFAVALPFCNQQPKFHETLEVELVALPKSQHDVPDRAARAKVVTGETPAPMPEPPPVRESDLVIHKDNPEPDPGITDEERRRQELLDKIERQRLLQQLEDAPEGAVDRLASDPNGVEDLELAVLGTQSKGDPELARWKARVQSLLKQRFHPLTQGQELLTVVHLELDPGTGRILSSAVSRGSGVIAFDQAALRVVQDLGALEPPPAKFHPLIAAEGVDFNFTPP